MAAGAGGSVGLLDNQILWESKEKIELCKQQAEECVYNKQKNVLAAPRGVYLYVATGADR